MAGSIIDRPNIFRYENLCQYLSDMVFFLKHIRKMPKTKVAKAANFGSPSYLKMIIDGERNLSIKSAAQLARAMGLSADETEYLQLLLRYEQSATELEKTSYSQSMQRFRDFYDLKEIDRDYYELFSRWYITAILEYIGSSPAAVEIKELAKSLDVSSDEVSSSIDLLQKLNLIKFEKGGWVKTSASIQTPKQVESRLVESYTREMLMQALKNLSVEDQDKRNYQALTVPLTKEQYRRLTEKIWKFISEINAESNSTKDPDGIYQLNVQLFSLLHIEKESQTQQDVSLKA